MGRVTMETGLGAAHTVAQTPRVRADYQPGTLASTKDGRGCITAMIKRLPGNRFRLFTSDGKRPLGPPTTREKALAQERTIKAAEAARGKR